ncbi:MAG: carboxypeptidase regulatory-like domain-containing protein [Saprospiraceae bacterium]|nr:carboxypeptidase regulatory-like domain-containing protein [Saprospiraceae bacterium]
MNKVCTLLFALLQLFSSVQESGTIEGKVSEVNSGEPIIFATVALYKNGVLVNGIETDLDGNYFLSEVQPGTYDMEASLIGYATQKLKNIVVKAGRNNIVHFQLSDDAVLLDLGLKVVQYNVKLIEIDNTTTGITTADNIRKLPTKNVDAIAATSVGVSSAGDISIRGSRSAETVYFIDGVRVTSGAIEEKIHEETSQAGLVTAGEWNDLNNWEKWSELLKQDEFKYMNKYWGIYTHHRYPVFVTNEDNNPIAGVSVYLKNHKDSIVWRAVTDIHGRAELFDISDQPKPRLSLHYEYEEIKNKLTLHNENKDQGTNIKLKTACTSTTKANIAFVVDATGSMSDEINFLKSDLASVIESIETRNRDVSISYSSVFYRDKGDTYVTRAQDFTKDERQLISFIGNQSACGGGDFAEAVDSALIHTLDLSWEVDAEVKLIFLILDAPPHLQQIEKYKKAVIKAANMGIKIIPVTGSGINRETDFLMKFTAILTNGTYAFITNHSGIGGDHLAPVHDEYEVEKLNELLTRVINGYLYSSPCEQILVDDKNKVTIYPNPAKDVINITVSEGDLKKVETLSNSGQILISPKVTDEESISVNISNLISGQYFVKLTFAEKVITKSFIKID